MNELVLEGCTPTPLAGYLKALGVLRLLGEQKPDWAVRGAWQEDRFVLRSLVFSGDVQEDRQRLQAFFLDEYRPTPIVAPWNGRAGFLEGEDDEEGGESNRAGAQMVRAYTDEKVAERFEGFKNSLISIGNIEILKELNSVRAKWKELKREADAKKKAKIILTETEKGELKRAEEKVKVLKANILQELRNQISTDSLAWFDACQILSEKPLYAPLLGSGGLDGSMDFGVNFMQRLAYLIDIASGYPTQMARQLMPASLFAEPVPSLVKVSIGQFSPGDAGGPNAGAGFDADSLVNPWDFIFTIEGSLLFAAGITRKLGVAEPGMLSYPFTVHASGLGNGSMGGADESLAKAEIWMPIWSRFVSVGEIKSLLSEGRATLGRRPVRDGLGFVRAAASLGVDRGIAEFQRYGFLKRSGKSFLATPLTRVAVRRNPEADLIEQLESGQFLDRLRQFARKDEAPARIRSHVRQLEDALFELAQRSEPRTLQNVIIHIGALSQLLGKSRKGRDAVPVPVPTLSEAWALKADDGSPEFRMAAALAGLYGAGLPMRPFFSSVKQEKHGGWSWDAESRLAVWGEGDLPGSLGRVIDRRRLEALRQGDETTSFQFRAGVSGGDVAAWLNGDVDEARLAGLLSGLVHVRIPEHLTSRGEREVLPAAYSVLKPFFVPEGLLAHFDLLSPERMLFLPGELVTRLQSGDVQKAVEIAWRRLHAVGYPLLPHPNKPPLAHGLNGPRLLAALAVPLALSDLAQCLRTMTRKPTNETV
jgi:CRISPR-associated protein Csx17